MKDAAVEPQMDVCAVIALLRRSRLCPLPHDMQILEQDPRREGQPLPPRCAVVSRGEAGEIVLEVLSEGFSKAELLDLHDSCRVMSQRSELPQTDAGCRITPLGCTMVIEDSEVENLTFRFEIQPQA